MTGRTDEAWQPGMTGRRVRCTLGPSVIHAVAVGVNTAYRWANVMPEGGTSCVLIQHPWLMEPAPENTDQDQETPDA